MPLLQPLPQRHAQVAHVFFVHRQIGVARDAELRELGHLAAREQVGKVRADDARQRDELHALGRDLCWQADHTRQDARNLDDSDLVLAPERIAALQAHDEVQRLVGHLRKGMRGIEPHRNQQRTHITLKILFHPALLRGIALAMRHHANAVGSKRGRQGFVVERVLPLDQGMRLFRQCLKRGLVVFALGLALQRRRQVRRSAHLKELVQIGRHDAQIAQPLHQRHILAHRPVKYPLVERQNAVITIQQRDSLAIQSYRCTLWWFRNKALCDCHGSWR
ncbi:hypothetical protein SDC9_122667 [bioreactor metagenome]|uniref:Uncharacterized protein n=1 Tax=bioreactor metagenome TaxID=1076179 RepID=A0A645CFJ3_9ZZZZ